MEMNDLEMAQRIAQVIRYSGLRTNAAFAEHCGFTPQYLQKLLNGDCLGLSSLGTILEKFPEIDARWFLFGTGCMIDIFPRLESVNRTIIFSEFIPFMTADDRRRLAEGDAFCEDDYLRWHRTRMADKDEIDSKLRKHLEKAAK